MFVALRRTVRTRARAFSIFELVAVLVIIGALAAVAVPRVVVLTSAAHHAKVASIAAAFDTGIRIASLRCVIAGWEGKDNLPGYADATVDFNAACFPTDTLGNANTIAGNASRCVNVWKGILLQAPSITTSGSGVDFAATAQGNRCTYTYRGDTSTTRRFVYNSATGQIAITNP